MDLTSLYLRTFFGAKPFLSSELDSLAKRMGVLGSLSADSRDRYFVTEAGSVMAAAFGNKIVFGRRYYERLSDEERLAVGAHEFGHILHQDNERMKIALKSLGISLLLVACTFVALHSILLAECAFCLSFVGMMQVFSSRDVERSRLQELKCDRTAASIVGGEPMISSIRLAESMLIQKTRARFLRRSRKEADPTLEERRSAILALNF